MSDKSIKSGKIADILATMKLKEVARDDENKKKINKLLVIFAIVGAVAAIAGICYALYKYFTPEYLGDFDEGFEEELEEDYFEDDAD